MAQIKIHPQSIGTIEKKKDPSLCFQSAIFINPTVTTLSWTELTWYRSRAYHLCHWPIRNRKTTLLRLMCQLEKPNRGEILIDEEKNAAPWPKSNSRLPVSFSVAAFNFAWKHYAACPQPQPRSRERHWRPDKIIQMEALINNYSQPVFGRTKTTCCTGARTDYKSEICSVGWNHIGIGCWTNGKILTKLSHLKERGIGIFLITHHISFAQKQQTRLFFWMAEK